MGERLLCTQEASGSNPLISTIGLVCRMHCPKNCTGEAPYNIGMSPSGKAPDFDSGIRRFEPCHPSHLRMRRNSFGREVRCISQNTKIRTEKTEAAANRK